MELIFEIFLNGCFELINNKNIKPTYRKILLAFVTSVYIGITIVFILVTFKANILLAKIILITIIILILLSLVRLWLKIYKQESFSVKE